MSTLGDDTSQFRFDLRHRFSHHHLSAAEHFSRRVEKLDETHEGEEFGDFFDEILWNSIAAVIMAFASVEARANELLADWSEVVPQAPSLPNDLLEEIDKKQPLYKLNFILWAAERRRIDLTTRPGQDLELLKRLRDALTHFKPEWLGEKGKHSNLSQKLRGRFFGSEFFSSSDALFPLAWASHSCTKWAVDTARSVFNLMDDRLGRKRILK